MTQHATGPATGPDAIVVGAGAAGLASAAMLRKTGLEPLILERADCVGSAWRDRYQALQLNSLGWLSRLPDDGTSWGMRDYPTRDEWVSYLERYSARHRLAVRFKTEVERIDRHLGGWRVDSSRDFFNARVVVIAIGYDGEAYTPEWPGRESFRGQLLHAAEYRDNGCFADKDVLIAGANTSGIELAGLIAASEARSVRVAVRTPPNLMTRHWHGLPMHAASPLLEILPPRVADRLARDGQRLAFGDLRPHGLARAPLGIKSEIIEHGKAPAVDNGFVAALKRGRIKVVAAVTGFDDGAVVLSDSSCLQPDVIVAATGYRRGLSPLVGHLDVLGPDGRPHACGGDAASNAAGLHFVGYQAGVAGPLAQIRRDAKQVAKAARITRTQDPARTKSALAPTDPVAGRRASPR